MEGKRDEEVVEQKESVTGVEKDPRSLEAADGGVGRGGTVADGKETEGKRVNETSDRSSEKTLEDQTHRGDEKIEEVKI